MRDADLLRLARSYLDYAGLMQGSRPLRYGTYTLVALIRDVDHEFAAAAAARRLAWDCVLEGEDATVRDRQRRSGNRKWCPDGHPRVPSVK